jgi:hypothetical protein
VHLFKKMIHTNGANRSPDNKRANSKPYRNAHAC